MLLLTAIGITTVIYLRGGFGIFSAGNVTAKNGYVAIIDYPKAKPASSKQAGEELFKANCTSCHAMETEVAGPALLGVLERVPSDTFIEGLLLNPVQAIKNDPYANALYKRYGKMPHPSFQKTLTKQEIRDIISYLDTSEPMMIRES
ncbi:MAG TPA: cytochrome c [Chitinophagaceae bacterium]|nr:cytochrome c [Chitinophagaceae bacterium]